MSSPILLASNNLHKLEELRDMLEPHGFSVLRPRDVGLALDVAETGASFAENARLKAEAFCHASGMLTLADDSGLVVDALGGEPGIRSARYGGPDASDLDRVRMVLEKMREVPDDRRAARLVGLVLRHRYLLSAGWRDCAALTRRCRRA